MTNCITYEDRAVAFIDVLGFKSLVTKSVNDDVDLKRLNYLVDLLSSSVPNLNNLVNNDVPNHLIPKHTYISDCIILSAPLIDNDYKYYNGVQVLIMRVIQLTHFFLELGYLIRGGIAVGKVWHSDGNIVGPAYQDAFCLEQKACVPAVVISDDAQLLCDSGSRMNIKFEDKNIVNVLLDIYIPQSDVYGGIEKRYDKYKSIIDENVSGSLPESVKEKWRWFSRYLLSEARDRLLS